MENEDGNAVQSKRKGSTNKCLSCFVKRNEHVMTYAPENGGGRKKRRRLDTSNILGQVTLVRELFLHVGTTHQPSEHVFLSLISKGNDNSRIDRGVRNHMRLNVINPPTVIQNP